MTDDELKRLFEALQQQSVAVSTETRRHFAETTERLSAENRRFFEISTEGVKHEVQLVAEAVAQLEEKLDREIERLDEKVERGFANTQAMIKFSHAELERRIRALEQSFSDLQSRVERLETTTH